MMEKKGWAHRWRWEPAVGFGKELMACTSCPDAPCDRDYNCGAGWSGTCHGTLSLWHVFFFFETFILFIGVLTHSFSTPLSN